MPWEAWADLVRVPLADGCDRSRSRLHPAAEEVWNEPDILDTNFLEECRQELAQSLRDGTQFMESPSEKWSTKRCLQETGTCQEAGTSRELSGRPVQSLKMSPCCWRFIPRVLCLTNYAVGSSDVGLEHGGDPKPV